jgi:cytochrome c peroxidase
MTIKQKPVYFKVKYLGGTNGATMRFKQELNDGANAGLDKV